MRLNFLELGPASKALGLPPAVCQDPFGYDEGLWPVWALTVPSDVIFWGHSFKGG